MNDNDWIELLPCKKEFGIEVKLPKISRLTTPSRNFSPNLETEEGIVIFDNDIQSLKRLLSIEVKLGGIWNSVSDEQPSNTLLPIEHNESGAFMLFNELHLVNAKLPIFAK